MIATAQKTTDFAAARRHMIESQLRTSGVNDSWVLERMAAVPREDFVPEAARAGSPATTCCTGPMRARQMANWYPVSAEMTTSGGFLPTGAIGVPTTGRSSPSPYFSTYFSRSRFK